MFSIVTTILCIFGFFHIANSADTYYPVLIWHSAGKKISGKVKIRVLCESRNRRNLFKVRLAVTKRAASTWIFCRVNCKIDQSSKRWKSVERKRTISQTVWPCIHSNRWHITHVRQLLEIQTCPFRKFRWSLCAKSFRRIQSIITATMLSASHKVRCSCKSSTISPCCHSKLTHKIKSSWKILLNFLFFHA